MARQEAARTREQLQQAQAQLTETERTRQSQQLQREAEQARREAAQLRQQISAADARETPRGIALTLKDVVFPVGKADLNPGAQRSITRIANFLKEHPDRTVAIEGFTDSTGAADFNRQLSEARANSVREALVQQGIEEERITAQGFGEQYPVANNDTAAGRQMNRRVEIVVATGAEGGPAIGAAGSKEMQRRAAGEAAVQTGMAVRDRQGREIGQVTSVIPNFAHGRASFARVSSADGQDYLVPLSALTSDQKGNFVTLNAERSVVENSPRQQQGMSEEQYGRELYEHYGLSHLWEESAE
jgi:outer membrane protein OmpA-like peptidoglycan-associated protein